jgi:hypothetical protein
MGGGAVRHSVTPLLSPRPQVQKRPRRLWDVATTVSPTYRRGRGSRGAGQLPASVTLPLSPAPVFRPVAPLDHSASLPLSAPRGRAGSAIFGDTALLARASGPALFGDRPHYHPPPPGTPTFGDKPPFAGAGAVRRAAGHSVTRHHSPALYPGAPASSSVTTQVIVSTRPNPWGCGLLTVGASLVCAPHSPFRCQSAIRGAKEAGGGTANVGDRGCFAAPRPRSHAASWVDSTSLNRLPSFLLLTTSRTRFPSGTTACRRSSRRALN